MALKEGFQIHRDILLYSFNEWDDLEVSGLGEDVTCVEYVAKVEDDSAANEHQSVDE